MNYLLKIVEGPNKGAEVALVEGLCIKLGKADSCDIILADPTLPDEPLLLEAAADGVALEAPGEGRRHLEACHVETFGSTSFAIGPADAAWSALVWPKKGEEKSEEPAPAAPAPAPAPEEEKKEEKKRGGFLWIVAVLLLVAILALLAWFFRGRILALLRHDDGDAAGQPGQAEVAKVSAIDALVERYSLEKSGDGARVSLKGDFATRTERLAATAQAYAAQPGIELDFADAESLKAAVEDTLNLVGEKDVSVLAVTNRVAALSGKATDLRKILEAVSADIPKIANVDCSAVTVVPGLAKSAQGKDDAPSYFHAAQKTKQKADALDFPVCGILANPYPCLVMRNGMRVLEGAQLGDCVVARIEPDMVVLTNATGRIVWKP